MDHQTTAEIILLGELISFHAVSVVIIQHSSKPTPNIQTASAGMIGSGAADITLPHSGILRSFDVVRSQSWDRSPT